MKLLVSACLLGQKVRYDGGHKDHRDSLLNQLIAAGRVVAVCPEVAGGLAVPRRAAEIQGSGMPGKDGFAVLDGTVPVRDSAGEDVTDPFVRGARQALAVAQEHGIRVAILKARSPSCGSGEIYDGTFSKKLVDGWGVTAALLERHGIKVFDEDQIAAAVAYAEAAPVA